MQEKREFQQTPEEQARQIIIDYIEDRTLDEYDAEIRREALKDYISSQIGEEEYLATGRDNKLYKALTKIRRWKMAWEDMKYNLIKSVALEQLISENWKKSKAPLTEKWQSLQDEVERRGQQTQPPTGK